MTILSGVSRNVLVGLVGVLVGAVITLAGEGYRDWRKERKQTRTILRGLRRSISNLVTAPKPPFRGMEEALKFAITFDLPLVVTYLEEGIALTATSPRYSKLYHQLVDLKRVVDSINLQITTTPLIEALIFSSPLPKAEKERILREAQSLPNSIYDNVLRRHAADTSAQVMGMVDRLPILVGRRFPQWRLGQRVAMWVSFTLQGTPSEDKHRALEVFDLAEAQKRKDSAATPK